MRVVLLTLTAALCACSAASDADAPQDIQRVLAADEMEGRATGTPGGDMAARYLAEQLAARGLEPLGQTYAHTFRFLDRNGDTRQGVNLVARIDGSAAGPIMVVTAHYDHVGVREGDIYNGADDNASGVAGLFAVADAFLADPPTHDVVLALLDAEELGLHGARMFLADNLVPRNAIALNLNFDMLSRSDKNELYAAGAYHTPALAPVIEAVAARAPVVLLTGHDRPEDGAGDWTFQSDHAAFHRAGIPFVYFGVEDHPDYHRPTDDAEAVPQDFFARSLETVVMAARTFDARLPEIVAEAT